MTLQTLLSLKSSLFASPLCVVRARLSSRGGWA